MRSEGVHVGFDVDGVALTQLILLVFPQQTISLLFVTALDADGEVAGVVGVSQLFQEAAEDQACEAAVDEVDGVDDGRQKDSSHQGVGKQVPEISILTMRKADQILDDPPGEAHESSESSIALQRGEVGRAAA